MLRRIYYYTRPLIPRSVQIAARRLIVKRKRRYVGDIWPINPASAEPPPGWTGWPEGKRFAVVLTHDVDTAKGHDRCRKLMELEKSRGFISSFYFVARRYEVSKRTPRTSGRKRIWCGDPRSLPRRKKIPVSQDLQ